MPSRALPGEQRHRQQDQGDTVVHATADPAHRARCGLTLGLALRLRIDLRIRFRGAGVSHSVAVLVCISGVGYVRTQVVRIENPVAIAVVIGPIAAVELAGHVARLVGEILGRGAQVFIWGAVVRVGRGRGTVGSTDTSCNRRERAYPVGARVVCAFIPIIAFGVIDALQAPVPTFIAVGTVRARFNPGPAGTVPVARFGAVTELAVVTVGRAEAIHTAVVGLAAELSRTWIVARLADAVAVARLCAVTE